jgi:hypothetical protein
VWAVGAVTSPSRSTRGSGDSGDDDRFARWQDITRRSLDFVNNVLIVLTSGLIAVVLNEAASSTTVASLHRWQLVCAGTAVILLGVSVATGVFTAANRLQSGRLTARRLRIGMLYRGITSAERDADAEQAPSAALEAAEATGGADRAAEQGEQIAAEPPTDGKSWDERALTRLIQGLAGLESLTRPTIRSAAERCLAKDRPGVVRDNGAIEGLKQVLREWSDGADNRTWWLIRIQLWSFLLGSAFFAAVPIWILLSAT